jgi:hypothetical protein
MRISITLVISWSKRKTLFVFLKPPRVWPPHHLHLPHYSIMTYIKCLAITRSQVEKRVTSTWHLVLHDKSWRPLCLSWHTNFNATLNFIVNVVWVYAIWNFGPSHPYTVHSTCWRQRSTILEIWNGYYVNIMCLQHHVNANMHIGMVHKDSMSVLDMCILIVYCQIVAERHLIPKWYLSPSAKSIVAPPPSE